MKILYNDLSEGRIHFLITEDHPENQVRAFAEFKGTMERLIKILSAENLRCFDEKYANIQVNRNRENLIRSECQFYCNMNDLDLIIQKIKQALRERPNKIIKPSRRKILR